MAVLEVKVPQLSESVSDASLLSWRKKAGDSVKRDENLIDIETDKVVLELPAPDSGTITQILKEDGAVVTSGETIALIDTDASAAEAPEPAAVASEPAPAKEPAETPKPVAPEAPAPAEEPVTAKEDVVEPAPPASAPEPKPETYSAPTVNTMPDSPPVMAAAQPAPPLPLATVPITIDQDSRPEDRVPMSRLRARIAERLVQSQQTAATLTTFNEVNMQPVMDLRNKYKDKFEEEHGIRLGFMSFFVKAAVAALKKYPIVNASIDGTDIVYHGYFDIGIAISSPRGLVVPVLRDADLMSIADIERKIGELSDLAQESKLTLEDLTGGTFSISNGGVFGSMLSTPILNPPQSAILGMHATRDRPVVENGEIVIRPMNYLALSYDHRLIDGREAVLALVAIKEAMEDPSRLLLDI